MLRNVLDRLPSGGSITLITENEPRALSARITQDRPDRFVVEARRVASRMWHLRLTHRAIESTDRNSAAQHLSRCSAFAALDAGVREELADAAVWQTGRRGQTLVAANADWPFIGMVTEGIIARANGGGRERERILYEIFPYELFGVAEYFDRGLKMSRINVFSKSVHILKLPWDIVSRIAARYTELTNALGIVLAQRVRLLADALSVQGSLPILGRIARVLLPYAMPERGLVPASAALSTITQSQIAATGGTVKEVAARAIAELESRKALRREHGHIRCLDREVLLQIIQDVS
ncbi:MAG: Crp/Fnr family transcriptional regulator [Candidatus Cybelea sp.]